MSIVKVQNVPLVAQPTDGVCWYACAQMVYKWCATTGKGSMTNPESHEPSKKRAEENRDWAAAQNGLLGSYFNMQKHSSVSMDLAGLSSFFQSHGPIWASGQKNWGGNNHGHVVVICGVADTGVFIHDPEPVGKGSSQWLTWDQIKKYVDGLTTADYQFLTAA